MDGKTHLLIGIASGMAVSSATGLPLWTGAALGALGGLLPDIDHPQSYISSFIPFGFLVGGLVGGHRGITHTALAALALAGVAFYAGVEQAMILAFAAGYVSHLIADMTTPSGVPMLLPVTDFRFKVLPSFLLGIVGWLIEAAAALAAVAAIGAMLWFQYQ